MLVLTQKEGEVLQIGDNVRIYIKRVKGNWVRLCIDAPREITLLRIPVEKSTRPAEDGAEGLPPRGRPAGPEPDERRSPGRRAQVDTHDEPRTGVLGLASDTK